MAKVETESRHQLPIANPQKKNQKSAMDSKEKKVVPVAPMQSGAPADKVSLTHKAESAEGGSSESNSANRQLPLDTEDGAAVVQVAKRSVLRPQSKIISADDFEEIDPLAGLPKVAIDYRSRYFQSPGVKKGQTRVSKPQESSDAS